MKLKWRAWDKENNKYFENIYEAYKGNLVTLEMMMKGDLLLRKNHDYYHESTFPDRFIVESSTGLKDKNGVEIYEGDIIKTKLGDIQEIKFISQDFDDGVIRTFVSFSTKPPYLMAMSNSDEVIGNIHENPELLKER